MKILLLSFYDLGKQPKIISELYKKLDNGSNQIDIIDYSIEEKDLTLDNYDVLGIYASMHTASVLAEQYLRDRKLPNKLFVFGLYANVFSEMFSDFQSIHSFDSDELESFLQVQLNPNYSYKHTVPDRTILPSITDYSHIVDGSNNLIAGSVETTYGCKHECTHCPVPIEFKGMFKTFGTEKIITDVTNQVEEGAKHISFNDPDFFNGPKHALKILQLLNEKHPSITYDSTIKVEHILKYPDYFQELKNLNMLFVISAFETTNDHVLNILQKNHSSNDLNKAVELSLENNIDIRPTWMPFSPWTEQNDLISIIKLIENYKLRETVDPIQLTIKLLVPKNSLILKRPEMKEYLLDYDPASFSYAWKYKFPNIDNIQNELFTYVLQHESENDYTQYLGLVDILESHTNETLLNSEKYSQRIVPKLSETWFCCAEPNKIQLDRIKSNKALI
ncbi:hypothetical protein N9R67_00530 [Candidatus Actinomarina sp.]|nr:hypothetical protein [Candidatus Actinomarina sp.]